ncbi:ABC transporter permease [Clostridium sp. PL3]|uniref:ABC transporter permease n=1 Tax=Clostridium thailandense TaxID=2794346 RepID=A0A949TJ58_9CLOT|nr:ABC transporter permease [Clostridium thailandense]MBV7273804.1 ABC transporter permease [Clostridium thailandense]
MLEMFSKELKSYFHSSSSYIFLFVFSLLSGIFFTLSNLIPGSGYYPNILYSMVFVFLFLVPILTMKIIASETHEKTDQLLLTSPLRIWEIVVGKFLASTTVFFIAVIITFIYPLILKKFGSIPVGETIGAYIGFVLIGICFISIGVFISALTENQVTAAVSTFGILFIIFILDWIGSGLPTTITSGVIFAEILIAIVALFLYYNAQNIIISVSTFLIGSLVVLIVYLKNKNLYDGFIVKFVDWFSLIKRYEPFNMGMLSVSSIAYYISFCAFFILLSINVMDRRRWS